MTETIAFLLNKNRITIIFLINFQYITLRAPNEDACTKLRCMHARVKKESSENCSKTICDLT